MNPESPSSAPRRWALAVGVVALATIVAGCAKDAPQDTWKPAGPNAQKIQDLQWWVFLIAGIVGVIVFTVVGFVVVRFRDRGQEMPEQTHGKPALEISLTVLPAVILLVVGTFTVGAIFDLAKTDDSQCVINVTGQQWWWEYDYPAGDCGGVHIAEPIVTANQLVLPTNVPVLLNITSRDVIHSYWIPKLNGKRDAVPGRVHPLRMEAGQPGIYSGQCTEFCGLSHARMRMEAVALYPEDFQTWVDNQLEAYTAPEPGSLAAAGETEFLNQCVRCHQVNGILQSNGTPAIAAPEANLVAGAAPNLTNLMTRNTFAGATWDLLTEECRDRVWNAPPEEFGKRYLEGVTPDCLNEVELREWLRNAPEKKPMYADPNSLEASNGLYRGMPDLNLTDDQIDQLIAYLTERK